MMALGFVSTPLTDHQSLDAISEAASFVLPLGAAWGRNIDCVEITGDTAAARVWFDLMPVAFSGSK